MARLILGLISGIVLGFVVQSAAQFGSPRFDERAKSWNERSYERQQQQFQAPNPWQRPC